MQRERVTSSNLRSVGYDPTETILEVEFHNRSIYHYFHVPAHVHAELMAATSHGTYLAARVKGHYEYHRIHLQTCEARCTRDSESRASMMIAPEWTR